MDVNVKLEGFEELNKLLSKLPVRVERKVLVDGLRKAALPIKKQARLNIKALFHQNTGTLLRSIRHRTAKGGLKRGALLFVESSQGNRAKYDAFYSRFLEYGTKYIKPTPFLGDALNATRNAALAAFEQGVIKSLDKEVFKLRK